MVHDSSDAFFIEKPVVWDVADNEDMWGNVDATQSTLHYGDSEYENDENVYVFVPSQLIRELEHRLALLPRR